MSDERPSTCGHGSGSVLARVSLTTASLTTVLLVTVILAAALGGVPPGTAASDDGSLPADANVTVVVDDLEAGPGQIVAGEADLRPGAVVDVRITLRFGEEDVEESEFTNEVEVTVDRDGEYRTAFDLSGVPAGTTAEIGVAYDGSERGTATTTISECTDACERDDSDAGSNDSDAETTLAIDGEELTLEAGPGRIVRGETALPPGSELSIELRTTDGSTPTFIQRHPATVADDGTFRAVVDLEGLEGATFDAIVRNERNEFASATGAILPCTDACEPPEPDPPTEPVFVEPFEDGETIERGQPFVLPVELNDADAATVALTQRVEEDENRFEMAATVRDGTGDGRVVLVLDTAGSADETVLFPSDPGDDVRIEVAIGTVDEGPYSVRLAPGDEGSDGIDDGGVSELGRFVVEESEPEPAETTPTATSTTPTKAGGIPLVGIGSLFVAGVLATLGVALLSGAYDP